MLRFHRRIAVLALVWLTAAAGAAAAQTRTVSLMDNQGFGRSLEAMSIDVPADWTASGQVLWQKPCSGREDYEIVFSAHSPDGRTGFRLIPGYQVLWFEQIPTGFPPDMAQLLLAQSEADRNRIATQFRGSNCHVARIGGGDHLFQALILANRPGDARVIDQAPLEAALNSYRSIFAGAAGSGMQVLFDARSVTLAYGTAAGPVEESLLFSWYMFQLDPPVQGPGTFSQHAIVESIQTGWVAPERKAQDQAQLAALVSSIRVNPEWQAEMNAYYRQLQKDRADEAEDRRLRNMIDEIRRDWQHEEFLEMIRG